MKEIDKFNGYTLVEEGSKYGLMSADGKILVPCEMDYISGYEDEMVSDSESLCLFTDFGYLILVKDDKCGFFFSNRNTYIEPEYDGWTGDGCMDCVYVQKGDLYGCIAAPDFKFKELAYTETLFSEYNAEDEEPIFMPVSENNGYQLYELIAGESPYEKTDPTLINKYFPDIDVEPSSEYVILKDGEQICC